MKLYPAETAPETELRAADDLIVKLRVELAHVKLERDNALKSLSSCMRWMKSHAKQIRMWPQQEWADITNDIKMAEKALGRKK